MIFNNMILDHISYDASFQHIAKHKELSWLLVILATVQGAHSNLLLMMTH